MGEIPVQMRLVVVATGCRDLGKRRWSVCPLDHATCTFEPDDPCRKLGTESELFPEPPSQLLAGVAYPVRQLAAAGDSLQAAIDLLPQGARLRVSGTCVGNFSINKDLTLQGTSADATLSGGGSGTVVTVTRGVTARIVSFNIVGASESGVANFGRLTLVQSSVVDNSATVTGGGIANFGPHLVVVESAVSRNYAAGGGGIVNFSGRLMLRSSSITNNTATVTGGGVENHAGI